jgi:hypothetical protein
VVTLLSRDQLLADLGRAFREHYGAAEGDGLVARFEPWIGLPWPFPEREPAPVPSPRSAMPKVGDAVKKQLPDRAWMFFEALAAMGAGLSLAEAIACAVRPDGDAVPMRMTPPNQALLGQLHEADADERRRIVSTCIRDRGRDLDLLGAKLRPATLAGGRILLTRLSQNGLIPGVAYWIHLGVDGDVLTSWVHAKQIGFAAAVQGATNVWADDAERVWKVPPWRPPWVLP